MDEQIFQEYLRGASLTAYEHFGAHCTFEYEKHGVRFSVYAPNAVAVELIGDFNSWSGYPMFRQPCGVWTIFVHDAAPGSLYKYRITTAGGDVYDRMDPFAFSSELRPNTASIVCDLDSYTWSDQGWMQTRSKNFHDPLSIYEVHLGSWKQNKTAKSSDAPFLSYDKLADDLIPYVQDMGYTHIEFLPLTEHPLDASWGYQTSGYFSADSRYGKPAELMRLIDRCHGAGIGVILDFVPLHFVSDFYALHQFDGSFLYESERETERYSPWITILFDYSKPHVISFMKSALDFWLSRYHFDGVRFDAVSNLIYRNGHKDAGLNEPGLWFLRDCNFSVVKKHPQVMFIAEDSSDYVKVTAPVVYGGLGFDYKWNLGWMHDGLDYIATPWNGRPRIWDKLTFSICYAYQENYILPLSHDEVVHGKKSILDRFYGSYEEKFHQLRTYYLYMISHPGKKLLFMGNELAEFKEWDESKELAWNLLDYPQHAKFHAYMKVLNRLYRQESAFYQEDFHPDAFSWVTCHGACPCVYAFERKNLQGEVVYIVLNFSNREYPSMSISVEQSGEYQELISTDRAAFGGLDRVNPTVKTRGSAQHPTLHFHLPPFTGCVFKPATKVFFV